VDLIGEDRRIRSEEGEEIGHTTEIDIWIRFSVDTGIALRSFLDV